MKDGLEEREGGFDGGDVGDEEGALVVEVTELAATGVLGHEREDGIKGRTLIKRTIGIGDEKQRHAPLFQHNLLTTELLTESTQRYYAHQFLTHLRYRPEAVNQSTAICRQLLIRMQVVEFPIQQHPLTIRRHILVREIEGEVGVKGSLTPALS